MRSVYICIIFLCSLSTSFGQLLVGSKVGLQVGQVQYERESYKEIYRPNYSMGGNIGAAITFPVIKPFSLYSEVLFTYKSKSVTIPQESLKNLGHYYYMEMPIMMRMEVFPSEGVFIGIGPNLSYWIGGTGKIDDLESPAVFIPYKIHFSPNDSPNDLQVTDANRLQLGLLVGIGKLFKLKDDRILSMEFRYEMGHSFLGSSDGGYIENLDFTDNLQSKYRLISFNMGYFWKFHKKSAKRKSSTYRAKKRDG
jgi:hypothetical protein